MELKLIPQPKEIIETNNFLNKRKIRINLDGIDSRLVSILKKLPCDDNGIELQLKIGSQNSEKYILELSEEKILLSSDGVQGAFYGIQTLRQIFENEKIPCCKIVDCPDFSHRGFYHDITRGKVPTLETLKDLVDKMAYFKLNSLQLYVEHTFEFKEFSNSIEKTGYITADEIKELDKYCQDNFIELIPSLSTFGHLFELLQRPEYKHLSEIEDFENEHIFWYERMTHHTIDPLNPQSFELIKSLIDQYLQLFSSNKFNICCDETFDLKHGKHKDLDTGELYIGFTNKIIEYLHSKGKEVMMWGDILLVHPEQVCAIPENVMLLNWEYDNCHKMIELKVKRFSDLNRQQIVCPGVNTWNRLCEKLSVSIENIQMMAEVGYEYGAKGVLNTNWGDYGNPYSLELSMCGLCFGAEKSWNVKTLAEEFFNKLDVVLYKHNGATEKLKKLSSIHDGISWQSFVQYYSDMLYEKKLNPPLPSEEVIKAVQKDCDDFIAQIENEQWLNDEYRKEMLIAAEGIEVIAEIFAKVQDFEIERHTNTKKWLEKYINEWLSKNKKSEISEIEKLFLTVGEEK